jgi:expansin (peptidoglycan-binding protein)
MCTRIQALAHKRLALFTLIFLVSLWLDSGQALASPLESGFATWLPLIYNQKPAANPIHQGSTYYGAGACSFDPSPDDLMVAAMNAVEYDNAAVCGEYVYITGPKGIVTVRIVDLCPECLAGHLDLSREAFALIADLPQGRVDITWQVVSPDLGRSHTISRMEATNGGQPCIRNHRNPIASLEYLDGSQWVSAAYIL